jgi:hypothetical protein
MLYVRREVLTEQVARTQSQGQQREALEQFERGNQQQPA